MAIHCGSSSVQEIGSTSGFDLKANFWMLADVSERERDRNERFGAKSVERRFKSKDVRKRLKACRTLPFNPTQTSNKPHPTLA